MAIEKQTIDEIRELIEKRDFAALRRLAEDFEPADIAEVFSESEEEDLLILFRLLPKDMAAECFVEMDTDVQQSLIEALSDKELTEIVDDLFLDDAVLQGLETLTVVHGKGTGTLRTAVGQFLKKHKAVKSYRLGVYGEGETGVTIVELKK